MQITTTFKPNESNQISEGVHKTSIPGLYFFQKQLHQDNRGYFTEVGHAHKVEALTYQPFKVAQINHSRSFTNVIRGMHAEGWNKLVTVISGSCFCALADIRPDSPTFSKVETFLLGDDPKALAGTLFVTQGIANSICVVNGPSDYIYLVDKLYQDRDKSGDQAISVFDPNLNINWPVSLSDMIISDRDQQTTTLRERYPDKF